MTYKPDVVIYHDNCDDGFCAAWVIHQKWPEGVEYHAMNYGGDLPSIDALGKDILVVDFSLTEEQCAALSGARILMLDHHKTAEERLSRLNKVVCPTCDSVEATFMHALAISVGSWVLTLVEFDMDRSGAMMAWDFAFPGKPAPHLVQIVQDRDLWRFERSDTKLISLYIRSLPRDFDVWNRLAIEIEHSPGVILDRAVAIQRYHQMQIDAICETAKPEHFQGFNGVPVVKCCPYNFISDVCHQLLDRYPDAPFAAAAVLSFNGVTYSLRSRDEREDVSAIAKIMGGGGHRNAAGFRVAHANIIHAVKVGWDMSA
ncbi:MULTISPECIES: DHHA1 domain-containing protein [Marivita]|uniref:DHHA1 domain-containing protein n=1 Tax=Marivita cryptomonadis TaxID=505252 RepID=A0A9Q2PAZ3_9RHOB|nr:MULTISPECIES: DHHA1 domain-containing protein [Marivita]MCR9169511.1 DHHA1 domain-containing protein [Paracoccaceae bacterium]MBM2322226.1 hypothetical protein [Marivita cryptomonadis]MBM2331807.1 hypothetical protein [Marivita cryptomonadis]MBM2341392.1 hypothetical protein [Marivita cryptomonadis]MBM2346055.1 hypothetical protein [Marivita cryptomonadis]